MTTKIKQLRQMKAEARALKAKALQARYAAERADDPGERENAEKKWARYRAFADVVEFEEEEIEMAINSLEKPEWRRVLSLRFVDGMTITQTARKMNYSERAVVNLTREALDALNEE